VSQNLLPRKVKQDLGDIGERRAPFGEVAGEVLQRRSLVLRVAVLGVELDEPTGVGERDERELEGGLLGGGQVAVCEGALEPCGGMALRGHEHTFS
jgi:hypothetical protein